MKKILIPRTEKYATYKATINKNLQNLLRQINNHRKEPRNEPKHIREQVYVGDGTANPWYWDNYCSTQDKENKLILISQQIKYINLYICRYIYMSGKIKELNM